MFQLEDSHAERIIISYSTFFFYPGFQWIEHGSSTLGELLYSSLPIQILISPGIASQTHLE